MSSIPPPTGPLPSVPTANPRKFSVNRPAPRPANIRPQLSTHPRPPAFTPTHTLTTHVLPAALPRNPSTGQPIRAWVKGTTETLIREKKMASSGASGLPVTDLGLWTTVNRFARNSPCEAGRAGITLIATHPIGFHKETWEEAFINIINLTESPSSPIRIEEIWSVEAVHHGDTALLNAERMPKLFDRSDYAKDIANLCIHYMPEEPRGPLPHHLDVLDQSTVDNRLARGFSSRIVIGLGHSMGGDSQALASIYFPILFSACILLETTIFPITANSHDRTLAAAASALGRRSSWASRAEAREAFLKSPVFRAFHPAVLDSYITHGLYEDPKTGAVHLKQSPQWEAAEFTELQTNNETWELLPTLDPGIELKWIMGADKSASAMVGGEDVSRRTLWRRPQNCSNVTIPGAGHLLVQEKPAEVAQEIVNFLSGKYGPASGAENAKAKL
ncbi:Alpha/beta hydrolase family-domain-containing protein [Infundibulicybe gibba]|nr:Alpha/beta hydrolase family-domain-containing protein [Infundibulicybe gibba]